MSAAFFANGFDVNVLGLGLVAGVTGWFWSRLIPLLFTAGRTEGAL